MANIFRDIKITGIDEDGSSEVAQSSLMDVALKLSVTPPADWTRHFDERWQQHAYVKKAVASVVEARIVIRCAVEELERIHLPELRKILAETNESHAQRLALEERKLASQLAQKAANVKTLSELAGRLRFDD